MFKDYLSSNGNVKQNMGIYTPSNRKNVNIKDVVIRDSGQLFQLQQNMVYILILRYEHQIQNLNTHFNLGAPSTYGIYLNSSILLLYSFKNQYWWWYK